MVLPAPATIPARVLAWLVAAEQLGELHPVLAPAAVWRPPTMRDPSAAHAAELLTVLGWRDRAGRLEREVAASLSVLCRPTDERYGLISYQGATIGVLTARTGRDAVLAVRTPDGLIGLSTIPAARLTERLVAQAPHVPAAPGAPLAVSPAEVSTVNRHGRQRTATGLLRRANPQARQAKQLLTLPRCGGGELWVAARDRAGVHHVTKQPVRYSDVDSGRYLITLPDEAQVRLGPADRVDLITAVNKARRGLINRR